MRVLSHFDASRTLPELMLYVNDSGSTIKIVRPGGAGACALISFSKLEALQERLSKTAAELEEYKKAFDP